MKLIISRVSMSAMQQNTLSDIALVFEGGGMRASYSSGVLNALLEAGVLCSWVGGISAGASCTANYLVRDPERTRRSFVDLVLEPNFGDWRTFVQGKGMFNAEWIYEHTADPGGPLPYDFETFKTNPTQFKIGGFRCDTGEMVYWGREDIHQMSDLFKRVRASSTMPILMPWTEIDGVEYCDGALGPTGGIALDAAKAAGYQKFLVVLTRERGYRKPQPRLPQMQRTILRKYPAVTQALVQRPSRYNATLDELADLEASGNAFIVAPTWMPISNSERSYSKLQAMYDAGLGQARRQMLGIKEFCNLS